MTLTVYTDGSGTTGGPAGVGYVAYLADVLFEEGSLPLTNATNQQAEILAAAYALHCLPGGSDVSILSDSEYLVKGYGWLPGWIERGWRTAAKKPVANQAHWRRLIEATENHRSVSFTWTRGHAGTPGNERADQLAGQARLRAMETVSS